MAEVFNYNKVFMGVVEDRSKGFHKKVLLSDYRLKRIIKDVQLKRGRLLDIGCGGGKITECLPYFYPQMKVFGCDISKTAIYYAKKYGEGKVKYGLIKNNRLPYKKNYFDVCICLDVLEHIPDVPKFFSELKRVLKKNGLFYLAVPCEGQPFTFTWFFQKIKIGQKLSFKHVGHIHPEFTHNYLIELLNGNKFIMLKKSYREHILFQLITFISFILAKEMLEFFLGTRKAEKYYDRSVIGKSSINDRKKDALMYIRTIWLKFWGLIRVIINWEDQLLENFSFGAWKLFLLTRNIK